MKNFSSILLLAVMLLTVGCSSSATSLTLGKYVMSDSNDIYSPYVMLKKKNEFLFFHSVLSSTLSFGKYTIEDNRLILKCDEEGVGAYVFEIDNTTLMFLANDSTPIPEFSGQSHIEDKSHFELLQSRQLHSASYKS